MPATVNDAYHLLRMALKMPDPVIFIEHKGLYVRKGEMDVDKPDGDWGKAVIRREGTDVTIVTYSKMVHESLAAAETLAQSGVAAEVIDIRTLNPLDDETIIASVTQDRPRHGGDRKRCMTGGFAAELSARISERCFDYLEEPVVRVAGEDIPIPVSPGLERGAVPTAAAHRRNRPVAGQEDGAVMGRIVEMPLPRLGETMEEGRIGQMAQAARRKIPPRRNPARSRKRQDHRRSAGLAGRHSRSNGWCRSDDMVPVESAIARIEIEGEAVAEVKAYPASRPATPAQAGAPGWRRFPASPG